MLGLMASGQETYRDLTVGRVAVVGLELSLGPPVSAVVLGPHRHTHPGAQTEKCPQSHLKVIKTVRSAQWCGNSPSG